MFDLVAEIAVEGTLYSFDELFCYVIPIHLDNEISAGKRVIVPFGKGNRKRIGVVFAVRRMETGERFKPIRSIIDDEPIISEEMLRLCMWIRDNTFCTYFDAFRSVIPPGLSFSLNTHYTVVNSFDGELSDTERQLFEVLKAAPDNKFKDNVINAEKDHDGGKTLRSLAAKGALEESNVLKRRVGDEHVEMVRLVPDAPALSFTPKQREIIKFLKEAECASVREVCYACTVSASVVKRLAQKGALEFYETIVFRTETSDVPTENLDDIMLTQKQGEVYDGLCELFDDEKPRCALLRGVTGSGKTSVFIKLIAKALKEEKSAVLLVPEISLTPQMVGKFRRLFGSEVAVMHSSLSIGERTDEYRRIREGKAHIVIGTRSAVFAPLENIGVIVIDEEGEGTYKSESSPRYHARDVAKQRCFAHNALLLLASATPSLESYYYAKIGRYSLFELDERYSGAVLPEVYIVDMTEEAKNGNHSSLSMPLIQELQTNLEKGEQSILLLNRRGYHTRVSCASCGAPAVCPNCMLPLTYHKINDSVICHYCGYQHKMPEICPECGGKFFMMNGTGTQRIEDEISEMFPKARILRMDADTTSTKNAYEKKFKAFADGEYDIIVGTQMIAKGLNFPNVTLVGVLKTDNSLYAGDFRAYERTFSLLTQVVGRSGRGGKRGRALVQTFSPEHYVINLAARQNYPAFYEEEIKLREAMLYPPFCDIISVGFSSLMDKPCEQAASLFKSMLQRKASEIKEPVPLRLLGPAPAVLNRLNGRFRYRLIIKCRNSKRLRALICDTLKTAAADKAFGSVSVFADLNGAAE